MMQEEDRMSAVSRASLTSGIPPATSVCWDFLAVMRLSAAFQQSPRRFLWTVSLSPTCIHLLLPPRHLATYGGILEQDTEDERSSGRISGLPQS